MDGGRNRMGKSPARPFGEHSEVFWILFVLASAGIFVAVVEPARREARDASRHVEAARAEIELRRERLERKRRERQALESGDVEAWKAACCLNGIAVPGPKEPDGQAGQPPQGER
jgi:hypothetical protein